MAPALVAGDLMAAFMPAAVFVALVDFPAVASAHVDLPAVEDAAIREHFEGTAQAIATVQHPPTVDREPIGVVPPIVVPTDIGALTRIVVPTALAADMLITAAAVAMVMGTATGADPIGTAPVSDMATIPTIRLIGPIAIGMTTIIQIMAMPIPTTDMPIRAMGIMTTATMTTPHSMAHTRLDRLMA